MKIKVGNYIIIDKKRDQEQKELFLIFKFTNDKTIKILSWNKPFFLPKIRKYLYYNQRIENMLFSVEYNETEHLDKQFIEFLEKKDKDTIQNFYKIEKKYKSLLEKKGIKGISNYHFFAFNNISFLISNSAICTKKNHLDVLLDDGKTKKNSSITHFVYEKNIEQYYVQNTDLYNQLINLIEPIINEFTNSGFDKCKFYFYTYSSNANKNQYFFHCIPIEPEPIDSNLFYILSFYASVLFEFYMKHFECPSSRCLCGLETFHNNMDCYDIMNVLIEKNF